MSDTDRTTTAAAIIAFHDELADSGIPSEVVDAMVVDASRLLIQGDARLVVKADA